MTACDAVDGSHNLHLGVKIVVDIAEPFEVTVGKRVSPVPPRRSRRALLTHRAPPSGSGVEAVTG